MTQLNEWDILAIVLYFVFVFAAGIYAMIKSNRGTVSGYFLAGRHMTWLPVGASLFASNIGSDHFIGLAGSGAAGGVGVGAFEMNAASFLILLGWVFLPVFIASKVSTLPEFMSKRFGGQRIRIFLSVLSLMLYVFTKVSVNLYSGALFIRLTLGWDLYLSILMLLTMTAICTITGGLAAVIYTDTLQCFVMVIGSTILMAMGFWEVGGFEQLMVKYMKSIPNVTLANSTCGYPRADAWMMLREPIDSDLPWPGFLFGQTMASIWYWCTDQMMVQRALAAESLSHAQGGTLFTACLKMLPVFLIVLPGMISRVLYTDIVACVDPDECMKYCGSRVSCSNLAYPLLVLRLLPEGLRGVLMAVMLAALMSDLTSVFNSASTLFTIDIWNRIRAKAQTTELLIVGKVFVLFMVGVSVAWIPIILQMQGGQLFHYIQAVSAYFAPPIATIYILAVFWKRLNEKGAFWGLMSGFVVGIVRMVLDFFYREAVCGLPDERPPVVARVHYMYFALILTLITAISAAIFSLATKPPEEFRLIRTLYWTRFDTSVRPDELVASMACETTATKPEVLGKGDSDGINISMKTLVNSRDELQPLSHSKDLPMWRRGLYWLCGYNTPETNVQQQELMQQHLDSVACLHQKRRTKRVLLVLVVLVLLVQLTFYVFFTAGTTMMLNRLVPQS